MLSWKISWRNLTRRRLRAFFTCVAIVIGVASSFAVISTVDTINQTIPHFIQSLYGKSDYNVYGIQHAFPEASLQEVAKVDGTEALGILYQRYKLEVTGEQPLHSLQRRIQLYGLSTYNSDLVDFKVLEGQIEDRQDGAFDTAGAIISVHAAHIWQLSVGDELVLETDQGSQSIRIAAIVAENRMLHDPKSWEEAKHKTWKVIVPLATLQKWSGLEGALHVIQIKAAHPEVREELEAAIASFEGVYLQPTVLDKSSHFRNLNDLFLGLYIVGSLGLFLSGFIIFNSIYVSVFERNKEFAIMKTLGYTPGQIRFTVVQEVLLLGIIGTLLGVGIGYFMGIGLKELLFAMFGIHVEHALEMKRAFSISLLAGLFIPLLASFIPIWKAGKVSIIHALKETHQGSWQHNKWLGLIGVGLIIVVFLMKQEWLYFLFFIGVAFIFPYLLRGINALLSVMNRGVWGYEGKVATLNVYRQQNRMAMTSAILAFGISMIIVVSSIQVSTLKGLEALGLASLGGDIEIELTEPIQTEHLNALKNIEGVQDAISYQLRKVIWDHNGEQRRINVYGIDQSWIKSFPLFTAKDTPIQDIMSSLAEKNTVALDPIAFAEWGGQIGEAIHLETFTGRQEFEVIGVVDTLKHGGYSVFIQASQFPEVFGIQYSTMALINLFPSYNMTDLKARIVDAFEEKLLFAYSKDDLSVELRDSNQKTFGLLKGLVILSVMISSIGIVNTLFMNVMERTRELGMLRAIGITRWQIVKIVLGEGYVVGLAGVIYGIGIGLTLTYLSSTFLVIDSIPTSFVITWPSIWFSIGFGIFISLIASLIPALKAANIEITEALRYE